MKKLLPAIIAFCALSFMTKDAFAWFQVCNHRTDGIWVSYAHYVPHTNTVNSECQQNGLQGGCYLSAWTTAGWWRIEPNQCATVLGGSITNRYSYLYVESDLGGRLPGANVSFSVINPAFSFEEYSETHYTSGECIGSIGVFDFCTPTAYDLLFNLIDTSTYTNFIFNIT